MSRFNELAKQHRLAHHETQLQYAKRYGFDTSTAVSLWEAGKRRVPDAVIEALVYDKLPTFEVCDHCNGAGFIHRPDHIGAGNKMVNNHQESEEV
jgi:transcriptional regulator with XRE-family HTH domain